MSRSDRSRSRQEYVSSTPQFSPPPQGGGVQAELRRVHWGSNDQVVAERNHFERDEEEEEPGGEENEVNDEQEADQHEDDEEDSGEKTILAVNYLKGKMGCCFYDAGEKKLFFIEDSEDSEAHSWDLLIMILEQTNPLLVLAPAIADPSFLSTIASTLSILPLPSATSASSSFGEEISAQVHLEYRPARDFAVAAGKSSLSQIVVTEGGIYEAQEEASYKEEEDDGDAYNFGRKNKKRRVAGDGDERQRRNQDLRLASFINCLEGSPLTVGCAGALVAHLLRALGVAGELDKYVEVSGLELLKLDQIMQINQDSLMALQIFDIESHASVHSSRTKEGLSLFGVLNYARTAMGRSLMRRWFLRPSVNIGMINSRLDAVQCFLRSENQHPVEAMQANLRFIKNVPKALRRIAHSRAVAKDWRMAFDFLFGLLQIRDCALSLSHARDIQSIRILLDSFDAVAFKDLGARINDIIDWDESRLQKSVCVRSGVNAELDALRTQYAALPSILSRVAADIATDIPRDFSECLSVIYFPQLGYLIAISREDFEQPPEFEDWEYQFATEVSLYYKSDKCRDLDNHFGDVRSFIADKEIEILDVLGIDLLSHEAEFIASSTHVAELDWSLPFVLLQSSATNEQCGLSLLAFAEAARLNDWTRPSLTEEPVCEIYQGRHPLVELCVTAFVKNDTLLVGGRGIDWDAPIPEGPEGGNDVKPAAEESTKSMLVITGANFSGKSIYLKQVALVTFMAHIGSFVPADRAVIGLTDRIMTRIATRETVSRGSSAFMIDLQQISFALRNATSQSLILIDEFGKGTESEDGAGLLCGVLEHLVHRGVHTPRTLVATHFTNVLANELLSPALPIAYGYMEIVLRPSSKTISSSTSASSSSSAPPHITYLYRLSPGLSRSSHAAACASLFGIDDNTVARASYVTELLSRFEIDKLLNEALSPREIAELDECEAIGRRFLALELSPEVVGELELEDVIALLRGALEGEVQVEEEEEVQDENKF